MTGGTQDVVTELESLAQSNCTSDNRSYFDPPIENYRRLYKQHTGSHLSSRTSNNGQ